MDREKTEKFDIAAKLITIGDSGVGKTSVLQIIKSLLEKVYSTKGKIVDSSFPIKSSLFGGDKYVFPLY